MVCNGREWPPYWLDTLDNTVLDHGELPPNYVGRLTNLYEELEYDTDLANYLSVDRSQEDLEALAARKDERVVLEGLEDLIVWVERRYGDD